MAMWYMYNATIFIVKYNGCLKNFDTIHQRADLKKRKYYNSGTCRYTNL